MRTLAYSALSLSLVLVSACGPSHDTPTPPAPTDQSSTATGETQTATPAAKPADNVKRGADNRPLEYELLGQKLPSFTLNTLEGNAYRFDRPDTWTVLAFWGIWCGDCRVDAPYKTALSTAINQDPDLDFMTIHTPPNARRVKDSFGTYGSIENYFQETGYTFPVVVDTDAAIRNLAKIRWTPTYLVVDTDGVVRGFRTDLSVSEGEPVKDFISYIAELKKETSNPAQ